MKKAPFVAIDFDGTVTDADIIDAVLQQFGRPEWQHVEALWEQDIIGSRECLERQMAMVDEPLEKLLRYIDRFTIDPAFGKFTGFLASHGIPYGVISDGFQVFIERLLHCAGLEHVPVYANELREEQGILKTGFPYTHVDCSAANCKCMAIAELRRGRELIVIGDGRSDFCLAEKASRAFTKGKLTGYCSEHGIPHTPFESFAELQTILDAQRGAGSLLNRTIGSRKD